MKSIREEIEKYDKELDKYSDVLDFSSIDKIDFDESSNKDLTLVAKTLIDIKLELNLIRKNLTNDIEIVIRNLIDKSLKNVKDTTRLNLESFEAKIKNMLEEQNSKMRHENHVLKDKFNSSLDEFLRRGDLIFEKIENNQKNIFVENTSNGKEFEKTKTIEIREVKPKSRLEQIRDKIRSIESLN